MSESSEVVQVENTIWLQNVDGVPGIRFKWKSVPFLPMIVDSVLAYTTIPKERLQRVEVLFDENCLPIHVDPSSDMKIQDCIIQLILDLNKESRPVTRVDDVKDIPSVVSTCADDLTAPDDNDVDADVDVVNVEDIEVKPTKTAKKPLMKRKSDCHLVGLKKKIKSDRHDSSLPAEPTIHSPEDKNKPSSSKSSVAALEVDRSIIRGLPRSCKNAPTPKFGRFTPPTKRKGKAEKKKKPKNEEIPLKKLQNVIDKAAAGKKRKSVSSAKPTSDVKDSAPQDNDENVAADEASLTKFFTPEMEALTNELKNINQDDERFNQLVKETFPYRERLVQQIQQSKTATLDPLFQLFPGLVKNGAMILSDLQMNGCDVDGFYTKFHDIINKVDIQSMVGDEVTQLNKEDDVNSWMTFIGIKKMLRDSPCDSEPMKSTHLCFTPIFCEVKSREVYAPPVHAKRPFIIYMMSEDKFYVLVAGEQVPIKGSFTTALLVYIAYYLILCLNPPDDLIEFFHVCEHLLGIKCEECHSSAADVLTEIGFK